MCLCVCAEQIAAVPGKGSAEVRRGLRWCGSGLL